MNMTRKSRDKQAATWWKRGFRRMQVAMGSNRGAEEVRW